MYFFGGGIIRQILAIIPCYNEGATISSIVLMAKYYVKEVLVVDDGSNDGTGKIAEKAGATVIFHKKNLGKSDAIKTGFRYALAHNFDYIITIDGDGQHDPAEIPTILNNVMNNICDISIGIRIDSEMPGWRKIGKTILDCATSLGNGGFIADSQCGFRAFNKKAVKYLIPHLKSKGFSCESEQLIQAHELDLKVADTHVKCKYKNLDTSTMNPILHGFSVLFYISWLLITKTRVKKIANFSLILLYQLSYHIKFAPEKKVIKMGKDLKVGKKEIGRFIKMRKPIKKRDSKITDE